MQKLKLLPQKEYYKNFYRFYAIANEKSKNAESWYASVNRFSVELQLQYSQYTLDQIQRVIAVLSPKLSWKFNKLSAENVIESHANGIRNNEDAILPLWGFGQNRQKALDILSGQLDRLRGRKVTAFYNSIRLYNADCFVEYTLPLDIHMRRAAYNDLSLVDTVYSTGKTINVPEKIYTAIEAAFLELARDLNILPIKLQPIIWESVRNIRLTKNQLDAYGIEID